MPDPDGIVGWRGSLQREGEQRENVEVVASHCGLGVNPLVMLVVADRLAQRAGEWKPFAARGFGKLLFPQRTTH